MTREEAIEKIKEWDFLDDNERKVLETLIPELRESDDEKIRQVLIDYFNNANKSDENPLYEYGIYTDKVIIWFEKQGKNPNKIKSLFKAGDCITNGERTWFISDVCFNMYTLLPLDSNIKVEDTISYVDKHFHLWTIQDAKPGDVIYLPNGNNEYYFFIFKGIENAAVMSFAYFYQYNDGTSKVEGTIDWISSVNDIFQPATKEQRDTLIKAMADAEFIFDFEKKELKKIEQKSADKVIKPKFHEGEWIACKELNTALIINVDDDKYEVEFIDGNKGFPHIDYIDKIFHLWTIEDAKDGDVLVDVYGNTGIFQKNYDFDWTSYCSLGINGGFQKFKVEHENNKTHPAAKEQRNLLFAKMRETGYGWDPEKKELRKSQRIISAEAKEAMYGKLTWSEEDERIYQSIIDDTVQENQLNSMKELIDKSALVTEIEKLKAYLQIPNAQLEAIQVCDNVISIINTLEVKEVDLPHSFDATVCKMGSTYLKEMDKDAIAKALESYKNGDKVKVIIKAQQGE